MSGESTYIECTVYTNESYTVPSMQNGGIIGTLVASNGTISLYLQDQGWVRQAEASIHYPL